MRRNYIYIVLVCVIATSVVPAEAQILKRKKVVEDAAEPTLDSLAMPVTIEDTTPPEPVKKEVYDLAILMPFFLEAFDDPDFKDEENDEEFMIPPKSKLSLEFYEGVLIGLDSLAIEGFNANLHVFDTRNDTNRVKAILDSTVFENMDLLLGPMHNECLAAASKHQATSDLTMVSPISPSRKVIQGEGSYFMCNPTLESHCLAMGTYLKDNYDTAQVTIISSGNPYEQKVANFFGPLEGSKTVNATTTTKYATIEGQLDKTKKNLVIIPSLDEVYVSHILTQLNQIHEDVDITVFGMPVWSNFNTIKMQYLQNMDVHYSTAFWLAEDSVHTRVFIDKFRTRFMTYPSESAFKGYYTALYFGAKLDDHGLRFHDQLEIDRISTPLIFRKVPATESRSHYWENGNIYILKHEDHTVVRAR